MESFGTIDVVLLVVVLCCAEDLVCKALAVVILVIDAMLFGGSFMAWMMILAMGAVGLRVMIFLMTGRI